MEEKERDWTGGNHIFVGQWNKSRNNFQGDMTPYYKVEASLWFRKYRKFLNEINAELKQEIKGGNTNNNLQAVLIINPNNEKLIKFSLDNSMFTKILTVAIAIANSSTV